MAKKAAKKPDRRSPDVTLIRIRRTQYLRLRAVAVAQGRTASGQLGLLLEPALLAAERGEKKKSDESSE